MWTGSGRGVGSLGDELLTERGLPGGQGKVQPLFEGQLGRPSPKLLDARESNFLFLLY